MTQFIFVTGRWSCSAVSGRRDHLLLQTMRALMRKRYTSSFGVYQGMSLPVNPSWSCIHGRRLLYPELSNKRVAVCDIVRLVHKSGISMCVTRNMLDSWIGSTNAFLATALGLVAGTLYDRGY